MTMSTTVRLNPKLEALRKEGLEENAPPNITTTISELKEKTKNIHAGFLFSHLNPDALVLLRKHLCATTTEDYASGWGAFGAHLGFDRMWMEAVNNMRPGAEDPVTCTILAFIQDKKATLDKVVSALEVMEREDIINRIAPSLNTLVEDVVAKCELNTKNEDSSPLGLMDEDIILPEYLPYVPSLLRNPSNILERIHFVPSSDVFASPTPPSLAPIEDTSPEIPSTPSPEIRCYPDPRRHVSNVPPARQHESLQRTDPSPPVIKYSCITMLSFAEDGLEVAKRLAQIFRAAKPNPKPMGVLMLWEQLAALNKDPYGFVNSSFRQVDYIVPILTPGYLRAISSTHQGRPTSHMDCADSRYAKMLYQLMNVRYMQDGCLNKRVRCVIPDELVTTVLRHSQASMPVLQAWIRESKAQHLADKMLSFDV